MIKYIFKFKLMLVPLLFAATQWVLADTTDAYFDISFDRSINVKTTKDKNKLSKPGDSAILKAKGRLWLTGNETQQGFVEILCQNLSEQPVTVRFIKQEKPWLEVKTPKACSNWSDNLLICPVAKMEKGVFCKITEKTTPDSSSEKEQLQLASVNIRAVELVNQNDAVSSSQQYIDKIINYYASGIDLCQTIYPKTAPIYLSWVIFDGGSVGNIAIDNKTHASEQQVAQCIAENITLWKFPEWKKDSHISYRF